MNTTSVVVPLPFRSAPDHEALVMPRTPECAPWCALHCILDDGECTFCMAEDLPVSARECGGNGYVGMVGYPGEEPKIDVGFAVTNDVMTIEEAEQIAQAILRQVARARGQETK